jgi:alkylation response protein AidB-like acyl-CoA dehydrogenase
MFFYRKWVVCTTFNRRIIGNNNALLSRNTAYTGNNTGCGDVIFVILYAAELATKMALDTIQLLGGNGYINEFPAGRLLRDAKLYEIGAGTSEIRRMLIGRELFNESA